VGIEVLRQVGKFQWQWEAAVDVAKVDHTSWTGTAG